MRKVFALLLVLCMAMGLFAFGIMAVASEEPIKLVMQRSFWGEMNPASEQNERVRAKILELLNIDLEVVGDANPADQWERPNLMLASGEQLDIFYVPTDPIRGWRKFKKDEVIIPLNDLLDSHGQNLKTLMDPYGVALMTDAEGIIWAVPEEQPAMVMNSFIRADWLNELGMTAPTTIDELEAVWQAFQDNFNDVGYTRCWPEPPSGTERYYLLSAFVEHLDNWIDEDGNIQSVWVQPGYSDFLAKMAEWYQKGYLHREFFTLDYSGWYDNNFVAGGSGIIFNWMAPDSMRTMNDLIQANFPDAFFQAVTSPSGAYPGRSVAGDPVIADIMITAMCKNPEAAMTVLDYLGATEEGYALAWYGVEGADFNFIDKSVDNAVERFNLDIAYTMVKLNVIVDKFMTNQDSIEANAFYQDPETNHRYVSPFLGFVFDNDALQPYLDKLEGIQNEVNETYAMIVMGELPVSAWAEVVQKYMDNGGTELFAERTRQWKAAGN